MEQPANDNGGAQSYPMFRCLLRHPQLTRADVLLFGVIFANKSDGVCMGAAQLSAIVGVHARTLSARLRKLEEAGLIVRGPRQGRGKASQYDPVWPLKVSA